MASSVATAAGQQQASAAGMRGGRWFRRLLVAATGTTIGGAAIVLSVPSLTSPSLEPPFGRNRLKHLYRALGSDLIKDSALDATANELAATNESKRAVGPHSPSAGGTQPPLIPSREAAWSRLATHGTSDKPLDILIIGGGASGSGTAVEAASRGMSTALLEMGDFACGTSCRSTKLVHGGVRYLEKAVFQADAAQLKLVYEALQERGTMLLQAPHLCRALPTLVPCYSYFDVALLWCGMKMYDLIAAVGRGSIGSSRVLWPSQALEACPTLEQVRRSDGAPLTAAVMYYDGQFDDSRFNVSAALSAAALGAIVLNHAKVTGITTVPDTTEGTRHKQRAVGVTVVDTLTGTAKTVFARSIINAGGPLSDEVTRLARPDAPRRIVPSAGVHVVVPGSHMKQCAVLVPKTPDGRVLFAIPWLGSTILGTTDTPSEAVADPVAHERDVEFILATARPYFSVPLERKDVMSTWCGIRPLARDPSTTDSSSTQNLVREHSVAEDPVIKNLVSVTGGKWTTYRKIGEDVVQHAVQTNKDLVHPFASVRSVTAYLPLVGHSTSSHLTNDVSRYAREAGVLEWLDDTVLEHLAASYGSRAKGVIDILAADKALLRWRAQRLCPRLPVIEAEVIFAARHEMCETVADFVSRRSRISFLDARAAWCCSPRVAAILANEKQWSADRLKSEVIDAEKHLACFFSAEEAKPTPTGGVVAAYVDATVTPPRAWWRRLLML